MNNFKFASKFRIFAIVSFAIIVLGMALGTVFHFVSDGFFNYGGEYSGYKSVTVSYVYTEFGKSEDVEKICKAEFDKAGVKSYASTVADGSTSNKITYKFSPSTPDETLGKAVEAINAAFKEATADFNDITQSRASYQTENAVLGGEKTLSRAAIALAVIVVAHALYSLIRYKLTAMVTAFAIQVHNFGLLAAILALCRIPITSAVMTFAVITALATALCMTLTLEALKRARKDGGNAKLPIEEISDSCACKTFKTGLVLHVFLAVAAIIVFVFTAVSALSLKVILSASLCALAAFAVSFYGSAFLAPSVYPLFFKMCGKSAKPSKKIGAKSGDK